MTVTHTLPEPAVVRYRTRIPAFVDTSFRKIDRLSSGCKLDRSSVTASNQQSDHLRRQLAGLDSALRVSSEAFTISGIAEGALGEMTAVLKDIRTAVLDAAGSAVRGRVGPGQAELDAAIGKLDDIVRTTTYSGQTLLDGSRSLDYTETAVDGHPADPPLLDRAHTRIDQVNKPDSAVVTVAFTPTAAAPASSETPSSDPDAVTVAEYDESGAAVPPSVTTGAVPAESVESVESVESAESAESAAMTGAGHRGETGKTEPSPTPSTIPAAIAPVAPVPADDSAIPSEPARRASLEADNAQPGTDLDGAAVVADQEFVVTGTGGSRLFAFPSGTTVGEMADSLNAVADSPGVTATVIFSSDVRVDTAVPSRPTAAAEAPFVLQTVFPLSATDADVNTGAGETAVVIPESNAAQPVVEHDADAVPDQPATAAPAVSADPAEAVVSTDESAAADPVPDHHAASTVPTVAVGPDLVQSLVPGLNCDPDGRLYLQAGAETGSFTVYADKALTRPVGEVRDGVLIAADDASLPDLGEDALVVASDSASVNEGDVFVLAFNGLSLANDHDVTLSGDIDWFVPEQSVMNGARLQENTSRDGELHFRYTPTATNPDGTVAAFQVDAFTDPDCPDSARVATSGVVTVPAAVPASGPAPQGDSGPSELPSESSPDPVSVSGLDAEAEGETVTHTVRLTPVENPEGTDNGLYVALAVPLENLPSDPATATAAFSNLGLRLSSRDYGSAAAVAVQNRAGHLFRHPDDSHAVVPPGAAVHVSG
ncbi:MAG: hypothetical protein LIQ31_12990, partial [Planctomycetes bacterium]|nr:hypothetical protein [Planctomycetota bacterium]